MIAMCVNYRESIMDIFCLHNKLGQSTFDLKLCSLIKY